MVNNSSIYTLQYRCNCTHDNIYSSSDVYTVMIVVVRMVNIHRGFESRYSVYRGGKHQSYTRACVKSSSLVQYIYIYAPWFQWYSRRRWMGLETLTYIM